MTYPSADAPPLWICERCETLLRDDGRLTIDVDDIPQPPEELRWHIVHDRCWVMDDTPSVVFIRDRDIATWKQVARWSAHFLEKAWFPRSDWWRVVTLAGGSGPLGSGDIEVFTP